MNKRKARKGFTFIEVLTVITIMGLALPTLFTIIYSILRAQTKINALTVTKNEGDYAFSVIENLLRNNAISVHATNVPLDEGSQKCNHPSDFTNNPYPQGTAPVDGRNFYLKDRYANWFRLTLAGGKIASDSSLPNAGSELTTSKVVISNFRITCNTTSEFSSPVVSISFQIRYNTTSNRAEDIVSLNYQTKIKLRTLQ